MVDLKPTLSENTEVVIRLARIRQLCADLEQALGAADQQRELIAQMNRDADEVYKALIAKT